MKVSVKPGLLRFNALPRITLSLRQITKMSIVSTTSHHPHYFLLCCLHEKIACYYILLSEFFKSYLIIQHSGSLLITFLVLTQDCGAGNPTVTAAAWRSGRAEVKLPLKPRWFEIAHAISL